MRTLTNSFERCFSTLIFCIKMYVLLKYGNICGLIRLKTINPKGYRRRLEDSETAGGSSAAFYYLKNSFQESTLSQLVRYFRTPLQ